jgi:hypothetical protein
MPLIVALLIAALLSAVTGWRLLRLRRSPY